MKRLLPICAIALFFAIPARVYSQTLTPPEFPGGKLAFSAFLHKNLKWPASNTNDVQGVIIVGFFVEKDGQLTDISIEKSLKDEFDKEALRVIKLSPKWIPAFKNNKPIKSKYTVPISFTVSE
ncbi:MAG: energy transducer TonB [Mucilaginibacter sp.]